MCHVAYFFFAFSYLYNTYSTVCCRTKAVGPVQDIVATSVNEIGLLFVLHLDGNLSIWDTSSHTKLLNHNVNSNAAEGNFSIIFTCY